MAAVDTAHILRRWLPKMPTHFLHRLLPSFSLSHSYCQSMSILPFFFHSFKYLCRKMKSHEKCFPFIIARNEIRLSAQLSIYVYILGQIISLIAKSIIHISTKWLLRHGLKTESHDGRHWHNSTHTHSTLYFLAPDFIWEYDPTITETHYQPTPEINVFFSIRFFSVLVVHAWSHEVLPIH